MTKTDLKHYYVDDQKELINRKEISFRFLSIDFIFETADGIFSKDRVDQGSEILLKSLVKEDFEAKILDYGCGYGVVGIVLGKLDYQSVLIDITHKAIALSEINLKKNKVDAKLELIVDNQLDKYYDCFKTVLLNPPIRAGKKTIYQMFENTYHFLQKNGQLFIVIRKQHGAKSALKKLQEIFDQVVVINKEKGYWVIKALKV